jgi:opacity protein-like surface antigen
MRRKILPHLTLRLLSCLCLLASTSCSSVSFETGYLSSDLTIDRAGVVPLDSTIYSLRLNQNVNTPLPLTLNFGTGAFLLEQPEAYGLEVVAKLLCPVTEHLEPYFLLGSGFTYGDWKPQGTDWGFILRTGAGARYEIKSGVWISVEYGQWHASNGTKVFGHGKGPNPGFESAGIWLGWEYEF